MAEEVIQSNGFGIQTSVNGSINPSPLLNQLPPKKKRNLPGNPDPEAEVIALSPKTLMATNRFLCEICGKGFQRDQNLQLHRRGHNLPWKLKQRSSKDPPRKRVYVCPEKGCVHHHPSRALGDLTGIKKHFCRKHGEKKWKCEKCNKRYAVQSDWKAHSKTCGTREYKCDCGTIFSRRDSFITHRAFCDALAEESARLNAAANYSHFNINAAMATAPNDNTNYNFLDGISPQHFSTIFKPPSTNKIDETATANLIKDQTCNQRGGEGGGIPLWMAQVSQSGHRHNYHHDTANNNSSSSSSNIQQDLQLQTQLGSTIHQTMLYPNNNPLLQNSNLYLPTSSSSSSDYNNQLNWVFGAKYSSEELAAATASTSLPFSSMGNRDQVSMPSLYSTQHQQPATSFAAAITSATALLQKAAQIEASTSTHGRFDPLFPGEKLGGGAGGGKRKNMNNEVGEAAAGSKYSGVYGSNSTMTNIGGDVESSVNNLSNISYNDQLQGMYPVPKRQRLLQSSEESTAAAAGGRGRGGERGGQTRDFLGVGIQSACHRPSSIDGWI